MTAVTGDDHLLERGDAGAELDAALEHARLGVGRVVLVAGEAGVGKSSVVRSFVARHENTVRVLQGACDALFTPRPLGPILDIALEIEGFGVEASAAASDRARLFAALLEELRAQPTVAVFEDVHWADEATLDALKYLGRRIESAPSLLVLTFRDDEVGASHPLRSLLGDLPSPGVVRITLDPLSPDGVAELARRAGRSAHGLHAVTGGNPFFVTEVLAAEAGEVPETIVDAVLARASRLSEGGRRVLDAVAVVPGSVEIWLLEALAGDDTAHLAECFASGVLAPTGAGIAFRHELARLAVERSLSPDRRRALNEAALEALAAQASEHGDPSRLAHHADAAGNADAALRYAPAAAEHASKVGAHREAAEQYERALAYHVNQDAQRLTLLEGYAFETGLTGRYADSLEARRDAIALARALADLPRVGENLARLPSAAIPLGLNDAAEDASLESIAILEGLAPGKELAFAYAVQGGLRMLSRDNSAGVRWGERALELATQLGDRDLEAYALNVIGTSYLMSGEIHAGRAHLVRSRDVAAELRLSTRLASAYSMLASGLGEMYELEESERWADEFIGIAAEHDLDAAYIRSWLAAVLVYTGRWEEGTALSQELLADHVSSITRITALIALGRVRARRGDPGVSEALDEALELALPGGHLQRLGHVYAARSEAAWLAGDAERAVREARSAYELALEKRHLWFAGELAYWQWKAGALDAGPDWIAEPYARQLAGDPRGAADGWAARGCSYEAARALADSANTADLLDALEAFDALGATPAAQTVRQSLRALGAAVPRGPRPSTRENPAQLTPRELQVLELVARGLRNGEIADELVVSRRTIDHHVSSILRKLRARTRGEAVAAAARLELLQDR